LENPVSFDWTGEKAVPPKMPAPAALDVLPARKIMVQLADSIGTRGLSFRHNDKVHVIIHEIVSDQSELIRSIVPGKQSEIDSPVVGREKDRLPMVTPLGDVAHPTWDHDTGTACHLA
jgi:hypothetical protein